MDLSGLNGARARVNCRLPHLLVFRAGGCFFSSANCLGGIQQFSQWCGTFSTFCVDGSEKKTKLYFIPILECVEWTQNLNLSMSSIIQVCLLISN